LARPAAGQLRTHDCVLAAREMFTRFGASASTLGGNPAGRVAALAALAA
jgi:hypothetical protein